MPVSPERDEYFPVLYSTVASQTDRDHRHGSQFRSRPQRGDQRARDGNTWRPPRISSSAIRSAGSARGFFAVLPVYRKGVPTDSVEERRANTLGVIVGAFQTAAVFDAILDKAILPQDRRPLSLPGQGGTPTLCRSICARRDRPDQPIEAKPQRQLSESPAWSMAIKAGDASWNLVVVPAAGA